MPDLAPCHSAASWRRWGHEKDSRDPRRHRGARGHRHGRHANHRDGEELLFGDDWESDPLIYSLYADVLEGRLAWDRLEGLLERAGVTGANGWSVISPTHTAHTIGGIIT